ncbi:hypothetical protein LZP73_13125 [Shewanella sp. AS16]|uniref:hypothetical protein n=1 Tax=Shewanella sp. AS16 TaxID=2907625 RepID=UPI001F1D147C|nr:hypothetical protein [Shewanella sp. AS16]MCE9687134.1 hypothetical protein [Shewanella sp. AS16]
MQWLTGSRDSPVVAINPVATDGHALTVRNLDAWYEAFNVQPGDKLYLAPNERVKIW